MEDRHHRAHAALPKITIPTRWNTFTDSSIPKSATDDDYSPSKTPTTTTDISNKDRTFSHRPHIPHRRHHRHHTRDTIQSAIQLQNPFSFDTYNPLRRLDKTTHYNGKHHANPSVASDHASVDQHAGHDVTNTSTTSLHLKNPEAEKAVQPIRRVIGPIDVLKERKRRERRADEVADTLAAVTRDAHTATRKLDDTYYALLERLGTLRATIASLKDLCAQASEAREAWERDMQDAAREVEGKIRAFEGFSAQERMIEGLVERLKRGKERAGEAEGKLEGCRGRLEEFQKKEVESRRIVEKRWRICWFSLASLAFVALALVVWRRGHGGAHVLVEVKRTGQRIGENGAELAVKLGVVGEENFNKTRPGLTLVDPKWEKERAKEQKKWERVLDEL